MADPKPDVAVPPPETAEQVVEGVRGRIEPILTYVQKTSEPGFPMWDRPNQESMVGKGLICKAFAFDGCRRANLVGRGLIGGRAGLKQAC
jgi:hypothetical protein